MSTVEQSPVEYSQYVQYISLAQMPDGNPAIALFDYINSDLRFIRYDGATWTSTTVDSAGTTGRFASLCVIDGQPAISYLDSNSDLKYARYDGSAWQLTVVDTAAVYNNDAGTSLKAQTNGYPAIAYYANSLKYAAFNGTTWNLSTVDSTAGTGRHAGLAFGPDGNPSISYYYATDKKLMFASFNGTTWSTQTAFTGNSYQTAPHDSLAFLSNGIPILSWYQKYASGSYGRLKFSWLDNGLWNHSDVDGEYFIDNKGMYSSLAILEDYSLAIAYYDSKNYYLDFAKTAYPLTASDPDIHYTATAWSERAGEDVQIDASASVNESFCNESGNVFSSVDVASTLPRVITGTITLSGQSCYEGECVEIDPETGDCLHWMHCVERDPETWECLQWQEGQVFEDPNDTSGRLQTQIQIDPTPAMPLDTPVFLHIKLETIVEDPGASDTRYCRIYRNTELIEEFIEDSELYIQAVVGDTFDVDLYSFVESDGDYRYETTVILNITDEDGGIVPPGSPDICGSGMSEPDGFVDLFDFSCLAAEWLNHHCVPANEWCNNTDIDRSGTVGIEDLGDLAASWLQEIGE